jgi:hypothetical protein
MEHGQLVEVGRMPAAAAFLCATILCSCCTPADPSVPWDTVQMTRELTRELREREGLASNFKQIEVLGWRVELFEDSRATPPIWRGRTESALVWGRAVNADGSSAWALAQAYRHNDDEWRRSLFWQHLKAPLTHPRPGEDVNGTWHAFKQYATAPTSADVCEFAQVDFLRGPPWPSRTGNGGLRRNAWLRATGGEQPVCDLDR